MIDHNDYQKTVNWLYQQLPVYQNQGISALNLKLNKTRAFLKELGDPHLQLQCIHIGGTNGKGSVSHMLAAVLQTNGYKTGLYTSPHLKRFTERIKTDGVEITEDRVVAFVNEHKELIAKLKPSFFEMTVAMAFWEFALQRVEYAVIEVGLGGRFDSTNVINPLISVITNISLDHQHILGDTREKIAFEKAGIIKHKVPVVLGEKDDETYRVFAKKAAETSSEIIPACENELFQSVKLHYSGYQLLNLKTACTVVHILEDSLKISLEDTKTAEALVHFEAINGLKGRWQKLQSQPDVICDTGHNEAGIKALTKLIEKRDFERLWIIWGMVEDKDLDTILQHLPKNAYYFYTSPNNNRALESEVLKRKAHDFGLEGEIVEDVNKGIFEARARATVNDLIFIGGSTFVVAEIIEL